MLLRRMDMDVNSKLGDKSGSQSHYSVYVTFKVNIACYSFIQAIPKSF